jgi:1-acyl-sn-glycerol-3-phosphate acyltransferase
MRALLGFLRGAVFVVWLVITSFICGGACVVGAILKRKDRPGGIYDWATLHWGKWNLWMCGVRVIEHDEHIKHTAQHVFVANHLSAHDIFALMYKLKWIKFVAKAELFRIPIFGNGMTAAGMIPIERANRKAAFASYSQATARIQEGASVAVYPEGTRGPAYPLRPFKKGPFVLAIQAQAPVVPVLIYGQLEIQPKGQFSVFPGDLHVHYLEPIPTTGMNYEDRAGLAKRAYDAMAACLKREYGVDSPPFVGA